jgi:AcrR family transcriptional regulator
MSSRATDDRSTKARIRDAAIECIAEYGVAEATARRVAERADVSPGSVIHHFGSMDELRAACDRHVSAWIRRVKSEAASAGVAYDPMESLKEQADGPPVARYISQALLLRTAQMDALVDELVDDACEYMEQMVESGLMKPTSNPRGRAIVLTLWSLGGLVLAEHFERLLGVDITATPEDPTTAAPYIAPVLEVLHDGLMTDAAFDLMSGTFVSDGPACDEGREVGS